MRGFLYLLDLRGHLHIVGKVQRRTLRTLGRVLYATSQSCMTGGVEAY